MASEAAMQRLTDILDQRLQTIEQLLTRIAHALEVQARKT